MPSSFLRSCSLCSVFSVRCCSLTILHIKCVPIFLLSIHLVSRCIISLFLLLNMYSYNTRPNRARPVNHLLHALRIELNMSTLSIGCTVIFLLITKFEFNIYEMPIFVERTQIQWYRVKRANLEHEIKAVTRCRMQSFISRTYGCQQRNIRYTQLTNTYEPRQSRGFSRKKKQRTSTHTHTLGTIPSRDPTDEFWFRQIG